MMACSKPGRAEHASAKLDASVGASGPHDFAVRVSIVRLRPLSRSPKPIEAAMIWLRRLDNQPAHAWLRDVISGVAGELRDA
jgi:DNA-binding transcriptional LysR family regulator